MLCSASGGIAMVGNYHGGGSPVMESIAITSQYDIESREQMVKEIAGIDDELNEGFSIKKTESEKTTTA